jgi:excinuclease ABC subunit C
VRARAENRPGVYHFLGPRGELLYVGKSIRIRDRLLSWLRSRQGKGAEILRVTRELDWRYVASEFEALLEEFRTIRAHRPRFNVVHRRDRRFAWIRLTAEPAPRLVATLDPGAGSTRRGAHRGERLFGPFPAHRSLPATLRELAAVVGMRDCPGATPMHFADQGDLLGALLPPPLTPGCARHELGSCPGPCAGGCTESAYAARVAEAVAYLEGRSDAPLERLEARMLEAAEREAFEAAARHRDRHARLDRLRAALVETSRELRALTFVYHPPAAAAASPPRHHLLRGGQVLLSFAPPDPADPVARARASHEIARTLDQPPVHPSRLGAGAREELFLATRWFRMHPAERAHTTPLSRYRTALLEPGGGDPEAAGVSPPAAPSSG